MNLNSSGALPSMLETVHGAALDIADKEIADTSAAIMSASWNPDFPFSLPDAPGGINVSPRPVHGGAN